ncbi:MAG: diguanylate cyclase [Campylobacterales bacterium]|nr:diguanylate cyclase [Campylobacterales bacterium]
MHNLGSTISPTFDIHRSKIGYTSVRQDITYQKMVEELSITDKLTGLYNRIKLESSFQEQIHRATRYAETFSVILADIDKFKNINELMGTMLVIPHL